MVVSVEPQNVSRPRRHKRSTMVVGCALSLIVAVMFGVAAAPALERRWVGEAPAAPTSRPIRQTLFDLRPIAVTVTMGRQPIVWNITVERFTADPFFLRNMHFADWDRLPVAMREPALVRLLNRYGHALGGPASWSTMDAYDWDAVPGPLRMVVFPMMIEYWVTASDAGREFGVGRDAIAAAMNAITMAESWFDHRAFFENRWGNRDIGLGQCSNRCRRVLAAMAEKGVLDFTLADADYFNPWHATRAAVAWFSLEVQRAQGDLDLATRAYHRGFEAAATGEGGEYLANVQRLRERYFTGPAKSPTWRALRDWTRFCRAAILTAGESAGAAATGAPALDWYNDDH